MCEIWDNDTTVTNADQQVPRTDGWPILEWLRITGPLKSQDFTLCFLQPLVHSYVSSALAILLVLYRLQPSEKKKKCSQHWLVSNSFQIVTKAALMMFCKYITPSKVFSTAEIQILWWTWGQSLQVRLYKAKNSRYGISPPFSCVGWKEGCVLGNLHCKVYAGGSAIWWEMLLLRLEFTLIAQTEIVFFWEMLVPWKKNAKHLLI